MKLYDLSPPLAKSIGVFPGDVAFGRDVSMSFKAGHHLTLSSIRTTLHAGAHADGPNHYSADGVGIDRAPLAPYIGSCFVAHASVSRGERIGFKHLSECALEKLQSGMCPKRILFRTMTFPDPKAWNSDFASLDPQMIEVLGKRGVLLLGIDTPSIDPETSQTLDAHRAISRNGIAVLEGICLGPVPEGEYALLAQPTSIEDGDAGFVRAVLVEGLSFETRDASVVRCWKQQ